MIIKSIFYFHPLTTIKISFGILLVIFSFITSAQNLDEKLEKPKESFFIRLDNGDNLAQTTTGANFELSLSDQILLEAKNPKGDPLTGLFLGLPMVGHYSNPYNLRKPMAIIELSTKDVASNFDQVVKQILANELDVDEQQLQAKLENIQTLIFFSIYGPFVLDSEKTNILTHNLLYHPWVGSFPDNQNNTRMKYFNEPIKVGIFSPQNLKEHPDLPFNKFSQKSVNYHNGSGEAFSPNNMIFMVQPDANFSSFWTTAISKDKINIVINNILLANTDIAFNLINEITYDSKNLQMLLSKLDDLSDLELGLLNNSDREAISQWVNKLKAAIETYYYLYSREFLESPEYLEYIEKTFST